ncbi:MAG TPA: vWA domain-containing protein [Oligoflexus sp.]|uniref:vWA domain-containing protein n=1 Tax=Oligoflexus sp. TaxID=1971216 RepID=UPI002D7EC5FF|nr:vWA domain-containing protein [Oligoflexus sp.]HET9236818.1 vWA domain-containing protein [Oligoflexus sp.]
MKSIGLIPLLALAYMMTQCGGSKFKADSATVTTSSPSLAFDETPLDISKLPVNVDTRDSGGPTTGISTLVESPSDLSCEATSDKTIRVSPNEGADIKVKDDARVVMNVKGRFCPTVSDNLTVLFIIDYSGSMGPNTPDQSNMSFQAAAGNDPRIMVGAQKSCGRLQAVEAILAKFKAGDKVNVGTVTFAGDIVGSHTTAPVDAQTFKDTRLAEASKLSNFCSYVAPDASFANQEMAVPNANVGGATNYAAAFNRAYDFLRNVKGRKAVYFITDGRPTAGGNDPVAAGKNAAAKLKTIENLYFNAFFLQNKQSGLQEDKVGFDNLVQTIGAPERVVRVDSAAQLAVEVGKEQIASFDPTQIKGSLTIEPYEPEADLKVLSFNQDPANPKAWVFETQTFVLLGKGDDVYTHLVKVSAKAKDGTVHTSVVKILYQRKL